MTNFKQHALSVLAVMFALFGVSIAASAAEPVTEGFDNFSTSYQGQTLVLNLPDGWDYSGTPSVFSRHEDIYGAKKPAIHVEGANSDCYLITPELSGEFSFYLRNRTKNYQASVTVYSCTYNNKEMTLGAEIGTKTLAKVSTIPSWEKVSFTAPTNTRVAILLSDAIFDDFTYTPAEASEEAKLTIASYASGDSFDFGTVAEGTTKTFLLSNTGKSALTISSIAATGGFTITAGGTITTIAGQSTAEVTVATPAADAEGALTIASNDANSPYVINLKSTYKVPMPIMAVTPVEVLFGQVTANATKDITVSNTGDAELTATIASDNEDFTVSKANLTVAAGQQETFTITYLYKAEAYGGHTATITVTPNVGEAVTISASASVKDPNAWTEDFSGNALPNGWTVVGTKWTFADGVATGKYEANGWLVTPKLNVEAGQSMTFQAKSYQFGSDIIVQYQKDDGAWTQKMKESRNTQTDFETYTIDGLEAGTYRFRIATENINLDNFEGFRLAASTATKETWHISYTFHYPGDNNEDMTMQDTEDMEIEFDGDNVAFNFPNPINTHAWMRGTKYLGEGPTQYIFANGQYIGTYAGEATPYYYCGSNGQSLCDMVFYYDEEQKAFYDFQHILYNQSQTSIGYYYYLSDVIIYKDQKPTGISDVRSKKADVRDGNTYDLQGRKVTQPKHGLYIINGRKVVIK